MEGEFRLGKPQITSEIADTTLTIGKGFDDLQSQRVGKGLQQCTGLISLKRKCRNDQQATRNDRSTISVQQYAFNNIRSNLIDWYASQKVFQDTKTTSLG